MKYIKVNLKFNSYNILIGNKLMQNINYLFPEINKYNKIHIISDTNVANLYLKKLITSINKQNVSYQIIGVGEKNKSISTLEKIISVMLNNNLDRSSLIIALGGGIVGDIAGLAASIFMRGIDFIQIPTTLLSQVDSSVGGKTAVNFNNIKNIIGTFYQPKFVLIDPDMLKSLNRKNIISGIGEIVKYGLIFDYQMFKYIDTNVDKILELKEDIIEDVIYKSINIKKQIVEVDEKEKGIRAILNFGHTIGHGLELVKENDYLHGEAVLIGIVIESLISLKKELISKEYYTEIIETIRKIIQIPNIKSNVINDIYNKILLDKKNKDGKINIVLPYNKGKVKLYNNIDAKLIKSCILEV